MSYPEWTPDPVKDAEEYAEYLEDEGVEMEESDQYKMWVWFYKLRSAYLKEMRERDDKRVDQDSERTESAEESEE